EGGQGFLQWYPVIVNVRKKDIHIIGAEALQGILHGNLDIGCGETFALLPYTHFGHQYDVVAAPAPGQPLPQYCLGLPATVAGRPGRIDISRVDRVETPLDKSIQQLEGTRLIGGPAEDVATKDHGSNLNAGTAQCALFHDQISLCVFHDWISSTCSNVRRCCRQYHPPRAMPNRW